MDLQKAIGMANQLLDDERISPTVRYEMGAGPERPPTIFYLTRPNYDPLDHRPRSVRENPTMVQFKSENFGFLCTLLDQVSEKERPAFFERLRSRISQRDSFSRKEGSILKAGTAVQCSSELPLLAEFLVRRDKKVQFFRALEQGSLSPGLTLMLMQLEDMIAFNYTLFSEDEYGEFPDVILKIRDAIFKTKMRGPQPRDTALEANTLLNVSQEILPLCDRIVKASLKAKVLYVKELLTPAMNLELNQDKNSVRTFLEKLGFSQLLIESLNEAERLYRADSNLFELKSSMGHLRSFLEDLHLQACAAVHKKFGGALPSSWGPASHYLRANQILTQKEEEIATALYTLTSDAAVHPLVTAREYARLIRNMTIEYGLLLLTKLDKLGLVLGRGRPAE